MKKLLLVFSVATLIIAAGLFWAGCKSSSTGPGPGPGGGGTNQFITIETPFGRFTIPTLGTSNLKGFLLTTLEQDQPVAIGMFFGSTTGSLLYAGDVSVNGNVLDTFSIPGFVFYIRPDPRNPQPLAGVNFDGSAHSWTVAGSSDIPAFNGSVNSPDGVPTITSPTDSATVSRSQSLTVMWTGSGTDSVFISVSDENNNGLFAVASGTSYTFSAQQMGTLTGGTAYISVARFKYSVVTAGSNSFLVASATGSEVMVILN
jgi:hypothetical protein